MAQGIRNIITSISQQNLRDTPSAAGFARQRNEQTVDAARTALAARAAVSGLTIPELQRREGENAQRQIDATRQAQVDSSAKTASDLTLDEQRVATSRILANTAATKAKQGGNISSAGLEALGVDPTLEVSKLTAREISRVNRDKESGRRVDERAKALKENRDRTAIREDRELERRARTEARVASKAKVDRILGEKEISPEQKSAIKEAFNEALAGVEGNTATQEDFNRVSQEAMEELGLPAEFFADKPENKNDRERIKKLIIEKLEAEGLFIPKSAR